MIFVKQKLFKIIAFHRIDLDKKLLSRKTDLQKALQFWYRNQVWKIVKNLKKEISDVFQIRFSIKIEDFLTRTLK